MPVYSVINIFGRIKWPSPILHQPHEQLGQSEIYDTHRNYKTSDTYTPLFAE